VTNFVEQLEEKIAEAIGVAYCVVVPVGKGDLLALRVLGDAALGERSLCAGEEILVSERDAKRLAGMWQKTGVLPCVYAENTGASLEGALSPASKAVVLTHEGGVAQKLETVRNFCNAYDLWMLERMERAWGLVCEFDGVRYGAGVVGDIGVGTLCDAKGVPICDYFCTKDTLPYQLASTCRCAQITLADAERGLEFLQ
jgi:CDP-6-deoxy-D-xylo-4-hexulose-3-dehydrase